LENDEILDSLEMTHISINNMIETLKIQASINEKHKKDISFVYWLTIANLGLILITISYFVNK